jgi:hypothetical protein
MTVNIQNHSGGTVNIYQSPPGGACGVVVAGGSAGVDGVGGEAMGGGAAAPTRTTEETMEAPATAILEQLTAVMSSLERSVNLRLSRIERMLEDQGRRLVELEGAMPGVGP